MRPIQHIIETSSKKAFEKLLPDEWVARQLSPDYGIDYMVEIFRDSKSTGKFFYVQLKGTDQKIHNNEVKVSLRISALGYYQSLPLPILFVVYSRPLAKFWGIWVNEYLRTKKIRKKQQTVQLRLKRSYVIDKEFFETFDNKFSLGIHKKVSVLSQSNHSIGTSYNCILQNWLKHYYSDLLVFDDKHLPLKLYFIYSYDNKHLTVEIDCNFLGKYTMDKIKIDENTDFLNYPIYNYNQIPVEIREVLFLLATVFACKNILTSLELYKLLLCDYTGKFKNSLTLLSIAKIAFENKQVAEYQNLVENSISCKCFGDFQFLNMAYLMPRFNSLSMIKEYYRQNLTRVIPLVDDAHFKGILSYNLANDYRADHASRIAFKYYAQARRLEPEYLRRDYWWFEVAGVLFLTQHYKWAEIFYLKVHQLSNKFAPLIFALIGDSLFFQGKFANSVSWFDRYLKNDSNPDSEFILKHWVAQFLISKNFDNIIRKQELAISITENALKQKSDKTLVNNLNNAIMVDPLCGSAWYNLGISMAKKSRYRQALVSFLIAGLIHDSYREAWLNALFFASMSREVNLSYHICATIRFKFGYTVYEDIAEYIKNLPNMTQKMKNELYMKIKKVFESFGNKSTV